MVAAIVSLCKVIGVVQDGTSAKWAAGLNLAAFVGLVLFGVFQPDLTTVFLDGLAGQIAQVLVFILGFIVTIVGSKPVYEGLKAANIPLIGRSFS